MTSETCQLAQNLARNCGYAVFPVGEDKHPRTPKGFKDAAREPERIAELWRRFPAPLIGIATGAMSGISVVDVDPKHDRGALWWREHCSRLLPTRTYETRSGGLHLYFQHAEGIKNSQGKLCEGIDTRGDGGYVICWFAAGFGCFEHAPPAPWPAWLLAELIRPATPLAPPRRSGAANTQHSVDRIVRRVANAAEGERNAVLFWAACRLAERKMPQPDIEAALVPVVLAPDFDQREARLTIQSAVRRAAA